MDVAYIEFKTWSKLWAAGSRQDVMWNVEAVFTCPCNVLACDKVAMSGLKPDWAHTLSTMLDAVADMDHYPPQPPPAVTKGFFLGDELLTSCGTPLANLTAVATAVRNRFPRAFIYTNEDMRAFQPPPAGSAAGKCAASLRCAADGQRRGCCLTDGVPSVIDAISIDNYGGILNQSGLPDLSCPDAAREADCVFDLLEQWVYPRLSAQQKVWIVPGLYGSVADDATDELLVRKLDLYWARAINDSRVVGIKVRPQPPQPIAITLCTVIRCNAVARISILTNNLTLHTACAGSRGTSTTTRQSTARLPPRGGRISFTSVQHGAQGTGLASSETCG